MTWRDILVIAVLLAFVVLAVIILRSRKKKGRGCSGNCDRCNKCK